MTTKTQDLIAKAKSIKLEDVEKVAEHAGLLLGAVYTIRTGFRATKAAKRGEFDKATYYTVSAIGSQLALRYKVAEMRRKGILK